MKSDLMRTIRNRWASVQWLGCILLIASTAVGIAQTYNWTTIAGLAGSIGSANGTNNAARFYNPSGIVIDPVGNLYVADTRNCTLRKLEYNGDAWVAITIAGVALQVGGDDGTNVDARFNRPN